MNTVNNIEDTYELSPVQKGMLFNSLYAEQPGVDILQFVCSLRENLNVRHLQQAWQRLADRHAVFRTSFRWQSHDQPLQDVYREVTIPFVELDWQGMSAVEQNDRLEAFLQADRKGGFELAEAPLLRLTLIRFRETEYKLVWTFHHIMLDGGSFAPVLKEVFASYDALCQNQELKLDEPRPYRDYIRWLAQQDPTKGEVFWRECLTGFTSPTPITVGQTLEAVTEGEVIYGEQKSSLSVEVTSALVSIAREHQLTLNTLVQGAWALLLSRYSGEEDVVFGTVRATRWSELKGAESMVGMFINTLPVRVRVLPEMPLMPWLKDLRAQNIAVRDYEHTSLVDIQAWSDISPGQRLFDTVLIFGNNQTDTILRSQRGAWENREFRFLESPTGFPISLYAYADNALLLKIAAYDRRRFDDATVSRMLGHLKTLLEGIAANPEQRLRDLPMLTKPEQHQLLSQWNDTRIDVDIHSCVHHFIEEQVKRTPDAVAVVFDDKQLTYQELDRRSNQLARHLRKLGVAPGVLVGICVERSLEMVVGLLGVLKAGGAYVPLDPSYPKERLAFMLEDAKVAVLLTQERLVAALPYADVRSVSLDRDWEAIAEENDEALTSVTTAEDLAYVIYTSGSTGKPKGVMVAHRNVANFFLAMDQLIDHDPPGVWLALTSISFDISVLELFWTLARGFKVIVQADQTQSAASSHRTGARADRKMDFSLSYFAMIAESNSPDKYRLLLEGARFADRHGFFAVWTPERHFHAFGGLYPNPSVTSAALAMVTEHIRLIAGSVVLPLHNPIRVAEEWSVVDNLSKGRVGVSFASGWHTNDFVFAPENYADRRNLMYQQIETVRKLWRGESIVVRGGAFNELEVRVEPRPLQEELPIWITSGGSKDTFMKAGEIGANLLTHLLGHSIEQLSEKIAIYRKAWRDHGHGPGEGHVTLMVHTFVGEDLATVREKVREPFINYLRSSSELVQTLATSLGEDVSGLEEDAIADFLYQRFDRFFETSGLLGTPDTCSRMIDQLKDIGVDEVACLIDFGVDFDSVMASLPYLDMLRARSNTKGDSTDENYSIPVQIRLHNVSHLQCTPSMARVLTSDPQSREALGSLHQFLVGGEALPVSLAEQLRTLVPGEIRNMYGPTETTIWSTTYPVNGTRASVPIGRPVANNQIYLLDCNLLPVPIGIPGELHIGGKQVAKGYLNRPQLTAEMFIPDPFADQPGARLYKTGDLARYWPDGNIELLGRIDHQVKIRGFRIELGEIESVLSLHPAVGEAVCIVREDTPGDSRIAAYLVANQNPPPSSSELRSYLGERLPEYMVPSAFVMLDAVPLTPNGKVDRRALLEADQPGLTLGKKFIAPGTPTERIVARAWSETLGVDSVGSDDNFFELGGHSLTAVLLVARVCEAFKVNLPLRALFDAPTVAGLAQIIEQLQIDQLDPDQLLATLEGIGELSDDEVKVLLAADG